MPGVGVALSAIPGAGEHFGPELYGLTAAGVELIDEWLSNGSFDVPLGDTSPAQRAVLLLLAGSGCGADRSLALRRVRSRRLLFERILPPDAACTRMFVGDNCAGLTAEQLGEGLERLVRSLWREDLGLRAKLPTPQAVGQYLRRCSDRELVAAVRPSLIAENPPLAVIQPGQWRQIRAVLRDPQSPLTDWAREFGTLRAMRPSTRKALPEMPPTTQNGRQERDALVATQRLVGQVLLAHPGSVQTSATLWSATIPVHAAGLRRVGHPTSLPLVDADGLAHPKVRPSTLIADGAVWIAGDEPSWPSVIV